MTSLTARRRLNLSTHTIRDFTPLATLVNLEAVNLNRNQIVETATLRRLPNRSEVDLYNNPVQNFVCPTTPDAICFQ